MCQKGGILHSSAYLRDEWDVWGPLHQLDYHFSQDKLHQTSLGSKVPPFKVAAPLTQTCKYDIRGKLNRVVRKTLALAEGRQINDVRLLMKPNAETAMTSGCLPFAQQHYVNKAGSALSGGNLKYSP